MPVDTLSIKVSSEAANGTNEDRYCFFDAPGGNILAVADGAGGLGGGAEAAQRLMTLVTEKAGELLDPQSCCMVLNWIDAVLMKEGGGGQTTCVLVVVGKNQIFGASVGDSGAWLIPTSGEHYDLTSGQIRKPLIGSGEAIAKGFSFQRKQGILLLASDGLLKYAKTELIVQRCRTMASPIDAKSVLDLARMPNGKLQDDATVVLVMLGNSEV